MQCSRRSFLKVAAIGAPLGWGFPVSRAFGGSDAAGVRLGVQTYSFRDMLTTPGDMADKMIAAMKQLGLTECEVFEPTLQPPALSADTPWRMVGGKPTEASRTGKPPEGPPSAVQLANREAIREWRLGRGLDDIKAAAQKFQRAGIRVVAFNFSLKDDCTDAEVERGLEMTRAMGTDIMAASTTLTMAQRSVPFFEKHKALLSVHGHSNVSNPNHFATPESFAKALAMSKNYRVNLDVGHFSASGGDPVAYIRANHQWITHLHIKDRKRNDGANMPLGQGDTPVAAILRLLKTEAYPIPAYIEYEYSGKGTSVEEVARCLDYAKSALA